MTVMTSSLMPALFMLLISPHIHDAKYNFRDIPDDPDDDPLMIVEMAKKTCEDMYRYSWEVKKYHECINQADQLKMNLTKQKKPKSTAKTKKGLK